MINWIKKHWEVLSYLVFGVLCTLLNIVLYALFNKLFGYKLPTAGAMCWITSSASCLPTPPTAPLCSAARLPAKPWQRVWCIVTCRLGTMLLDTAIMLVLGNLLAAQGAALMDELMQGVLSVVAHWLGRIRPSDGSLLCRYTGGGHGWLCRDCRHRRCRRPHGDLRHRPLRRAGALGPCREDLFNVLVIVLNYVFSKLIIFKKK